MIAKAFICKVKVDPVMAFHGGEIMTLCDKLNITAT